MIKIWIKSELKTLILLSAKDPEKAAISLDIDNWISDAKKPTSIAKKLFDAIKECKSPIKSINWVTDLDTQLSTEVDLFTSGGGRDKYLQAAYSNLGAILPTSVDCESCFPTAPYVDYKICSDDMLDALIFKKKLFKTIMYLFWNPNNFFKTHVFLYVLFTLFCYFFFVFFYILFLLPYNEIFNKISFFHSYYKRKSRDFSLFFDTELFRNIPGLIKNQSRLASLVCTRWSKCTNTDTDSSWLIFQF